MTLLELAERCEQATGPDRELDGLIDVARDPMRETILYNEPGPFPQKAVRGPVKDLMLTGADLADYISAPRYTASLDAAMTLVPEGWVFIRLERQRSWPKDPRGDCWLLEAVMMELHASGYAKASALSEPLALCAAALRARATLKGEG